MPSIASTFVLAATVAASLASGALIRSDEQFTPSTINGLPCMNGQFREGSNCVYTFVECPKYTSMCVDAWQVEKKYNIQHCARMPTKKEAYDEIQEYFTPETRCHA